MMTQVKERPIPFSAPMVKAILDGRKTMTRRVVKPQPKNERVGMVNAAYCGHPNLWLVSGAVSEYTCHNEKAPEWKCPYGAHGDRLWVKETWLPDPPIDRTWADELFTDGVAYNFRELPERFRKPKHILYRASWNGSDLRWRSSMFMPRWASRITLEVTAVKVERVQDISEEDALAEGGWTYANCPFHKSPVKSFQNLWESIHGKDSWAANPWVWAISFRKLEAGE